VRHVGDAQHAAEAAVATGGEEVQRRGLMPTCDAIERSGHIQCSSVHDRSHTYTE
jgi:hypothetical protein